MTLRSVSFAFFYILIYLYVHSMYCNIYMYMYIQYVQTVYINICKIYMHNTIQFSLVAKDGWLHLTFFNFFYFQDFMFYVEPKKAFFFTNFKAFHFSLVPVFALQHYELFNSCSFAHMAHPQRGRLRRTQRPDLTFYFNFHRLHTTAGHEHCIRSAI